MISPLRKTVFISLLGHLTAFSIFSLSFGIRIPRNEYSPVYFRGSFLSRLDFLSTQAKVPAAIKANTALFQKSASQAPLLSGYYFKPQLRLMPNVGKIIHTSGIKPVSLIQPKKKSVVMFYPPIPQNLLLYFKDRQTVHIELMFNITHNETGGNSLAVKRKISSGNLEADLLSMRYLGRYIFIQQMGFTLNQWHTVKIELSPQNDQH